MPAYSTWQPTEGNTKPIASADQSAARRRVAPRGELMPGNPIASTLLDVLGRLVERLPFTYLHVFPYSARPGTAAPRLDGQVPSSVADERAAELRELAARRAASYAASRSGGLADSIVIGGAERREALTGDYLTAQPTEDLPRGKRFTGVLELAGDQLLVRVTG